MHIEILTQDKFNQKADLLVTEQAIDSEIYAAGIDHIYKDGVVYLSEGGWKEILEIVKKDSNSY